MTSWLYSRSCRTASIRSGRAGGLAGELAIPLLEKPVDSGCDGELILPCQSGGRARGAVPMRCARPRGASDRGTVGPWRSGWLKPWAALRISSRRRRWFESKLTCARSGSAPLPGQMTILACPHQTPRHRTCVLAALEYWKNAG
jgi:hypothetical protein